MDGRFYLLIHLTGTEGHRLDEEIAASAFYFLAVLFRFLLAVMDEGSGLALAGAQSVDDVHVILVSEDEGNDSL